MQKNDSTVFEGCTLAAVLATQALRDPQPTFVIDRGRADTYSATYSATYSMIDDESRRLAYALRELGVKTGDRVGLWLPNVSAWLSCFFACARLGAIAVAMNTRFGSSEVGDMLRRSGAKVLVCWPGFKKIDFQGILANVPADSLKSLEAVVVYDEGDKSPQSMAGKPVRRHRDLAAGPALNVDHGTHEAPCIMFPTSGTTQAPKFVIHNQSAILRHASYVASRLGLQASASTILLSVPIIGVWGFTLAMAALVAGATLVMNPVFSAEDSVRSIAAHRVTHLAAGDVAIDQFLANATEPSAFATVKLCVYAVFSPGLKDLGIRAQSRGLTLVGIYGSSEVQAMFALQSETASLEERLKIGGWPVSADAHVRVRDPETQQLLVHGEAGELEIKAPSLMMGYFGNPEASSKAITSDGYFRTGDLGYTLADGSFIYLSRLNDSLRLGGFLVSPAEIEAVIQDHPGIKECQVVGVEVGSEWRAFAFVIANPDYVVDEREIIGHCAKRMAKSKVPLRVRPIDAFPVTEGANSTKIQKIKLRELAQRFLESSINGQG